MTKIKDDSPNPSHPRRIKIILSLIISISIDLTKQIKIKENCLNSVFGIYIILKIRIILEMNITIDINKIEIQSINRLIEKLVIFLVQIGISIEIKMLLLNRNLLIKKVIIAKISKIKKIKMYKIDGTTNHCFV